MSSARRQHAVSTGLLWISPWIIGFSLFTLLPAGITAYFSVCEFDGLHAPVYTGRENWQALGEDPVFWKVLANTALYATFALPLGAMAALGLALLLNRPIPGRRLWWAIIFAPALVPLVAVAMIWLWMFNPRFGPLNLALGLVGMEGPNWLTDSRWTMPSMVLVSLWSIGQTVVIYLAGLQDVPQALYEAADLDGAGPWQRLWSVTLPMISPLILFNLIIGLIYVWQVFAAPFVLVPGGGPERNAYFYTVYLYELAFNQRRFGYAAAMGFVQLGIVLVLTALVIRGSRRFVFYRGIT
jgi:multiple sugar transport system permease protein